MGSFYIILFIVAITCSSFNSVIINIFTIDNRHPYLDWKHTYSAHTKLRFYPHFAPEVFKHSFSFEDSVLLSGYSSVALTSKFSRLFLGWRLAYYWYRRFPYKKYLNIFVKMVG